jgi:hypothetical protein
MLRALSMVILISSNCTFLQAQLSFMKSFGGSSTEYGYDVGILNQGGFTICGQTFSPEFGMLGCANYFLTLNDSGRLLSSFVTGGNSCDYFTCLKMLPDSGWIAAGNTLSYGLVEYDIQVIRFDKNSNILWSKRIGGPDADLAEGIALADDGGFVIAGSHSDGCCNSEYYIFKLNSSGNLIWTLVFGDTGHDKLSSVESTNDDGFIVCGEGGFGPGSPDILVAKISSSGNLLWHKAIKGSNSDIGFHAIQSLDNGYIITGNTFSYGNGNSDAFLCKLDSAGNFLWFKSYGTPFTNYGIDLVETSDSDVVVVGFSANSSFTDENLFLMKTDFSGNQLWLHEYGSPFILERARAIAKSPDGGYAITGELFGCPSTNFETFLFKTLADGTCPTCTTSTISYLTTSSTPAILTGTTTYTTGILSVISPIKQNVISNMTDCSLINTPLPVDLLFFNGEAEANLNLLYWSTANEYNNDYFTLLKSQNGVDFQLLDKITGAGNSNQTLNYQYTDFHPFIGTNYYRLQQTDYDGKTSFSKIISIDNTYSELNNVLFYPNPANEFIQVIFSQPDEVSTVEILNTIGQTVLFSNNYVMQAKIDISHLPRGFYFLKTKIDGEFSLQKLVIR